MIKVSFCGVTIPRQKTEINILSECDDNDRKHIWIDRDGHPCLLGGWDGTSYRFLRMDRNQLGANFPFKKAPLGYSVTLTQAD